MMMARKPIEFEEKDLGYKKIIKEIKKLDGSHTDIGLWGDGDPEDNLAARSAIHELGSKAANIESRPFNRNAFDDNLKDLQRLITNLYNDLLGLQISARTLVLRTGIWHAGKIKDTIDKGGFAPLSAATIRRKGSSKPLIDTSDMKNRIEHKEKMK